MSPSNVTLIFHAIEMIFFITSSSFPQVLPTPQLYFLRLLWLSFSFLSFWHMQLFHFFSLTDKHQFFTLQPRVKVPFSSPHALVIWGREAVLWPSPPPATLPSPSPLLLPHVIFVCFFSHFFKSMLFRPL